MNFSFLPKYYKFFLSGTGYTLLLSALTVVFGLFGGLALALMKTSKNKVLKSIAVAYIEFIRGTPLLIQLYIVYYGISDLPMLAAGVIAMSVNSAAYIAEIIRAGIGAVDKGQMEAARSLGMPAFLTYKEIIIPQAMKNILPALGNEFIVLIKESAIVSVIGIHDLMYNTDTIRGITFIAFEPLVIAALVYFCLTFTLSKVMQKFERRMHVGD
ncbi:amino acid ABC transporter permease [Fusibacter bizertensis]|uniref:Amino acid ABC transporter permease n=1 Tax=Fusibacter bizertensis TaxID=1488331 RepID=A0ABT6NAP4_9FIRM|nr:amino acid ABC transporter permease [Fusibacter bizertensis]MDH8677481.1 amino acid ABC transporter permease [Fusibacter bizertensis]